MTSTPEPDAHAADERQTATAEVLLAGEPSSLPSPDVLQHVLLGGDLSRLTAPQRLSYYRAVCASLGLNPLTRPFDYLRLSGREVLYAKKDCAEQLRRKYQVSLGVPRGELLDGTLYQVWVEARLPDGRTDADMGAVDLVNLKGEARANAMMKAITKAKRRATLSICGLGMLDESELDTLPDAQPLNFDPETGEVLEPASSGPEPKISEKQRKTLYSLAKRRGWSTPQVQRHLLSKYSVHNSKHLRARLFDKVCADLERGPRAHRDGDE